MVCVCVCVCVIRFMCLRVVSVEYWVMMYGVLFFLYVIVVCVCSFMCSWVLLVIYCVVMYGLVLCVSCLFVSVPCFKNVSSVVDDMMLYGLFLL